MFKKMEQVHKNAEQIDFEEQMGEINKALLKEKGFLEHTVLIIDEAHNGFYLRSGDNVFGFYRCQLRWWVRELSDELVSRLLSPDSAIAMLELSRSPYADCGSIKDPHAFVFSSAHAIQRN
jgi:hypothetical protein